MIFSVSTWGILEEVRVKLTDRLKPLGYTGNELEKLLLNDIATVMLNHYFEYLKNPNSNPKLAIIESYQAILGGLNSALKNIFKLDESQERHIVMPLIEDANDIIESMVEGLLLLPEFLANIKNSLVKFYYGAFFDVKYSALYTWLHLYDGHLNTMLIMDAQERIEKINGKVPVLYKIRLLEGLYFQNELDLQCFNRSSYEEAFKKTTGKSVEKFRESNQKNSIENDVFEAADEATLFRRPHSV